MKSPPQIQIFEIALSVFILCAAKLALCEIPDGIGFVFSIAFFVIPHLINVRASFPFSSPASFRIAVGLPLPVPPG